MPFVDWQLLFARDFGCVHPGMPLGRKHFRRSRDAPGKRCSPIGFEHLLDALDILLDSVEISRLCDLAIGDLPTVQLWKLDFAKPQNHQIQISDCFC